MTFDPLVRGLQTVLDLRIAQHGLTASNLANADTPGYRAKVIDFEHVLAQAVDEPSAMRRTDPRHLEAGGATATDPLVVELDPAPWSVDGNSVLPERETARMSSNALMYEAVAKGLDHKLDLLRFAVTDGKA
ncbi:MAG: flagellar basal body rod protein FlgB [Myxococcota bacterium]